MQGKGRTNKDEHREGRNHKRLLTRGNKLRVTGRLLEGVGVA